jgi:hypothetical protein
MNACREGPPRRSLDADADVDELRHPARVWGGAMNAAGEAVDIEERLRQIATANGAPASWCGASARCQSPPVAGKAWTGMDLF